MSPPGLLATRLTGRLVVLAARDPAVPATVGGGVGTRLRRVLLRWQAPQPCRYRSGRRGGRGRRPYANGYASPYASPYAGHPRTPHRPEVGSPQLRPPRGSGAATPGGALRAIDSSARPRLVADLRSAPPAAASQPAWITTHGGTAGPGAVVSTSQETDQWLSCVLRSLPNHAVASRSWQRLPAQSQRRLGRPRPSATSTLRPKPT